MTVLNVINLAIAENRRKHMRETFLPLGFELRFFEAFTPSTIPAKWGNYFYNDRGEPFSQLTPGEMACYASHLELMERAVKDNHYALIAEDDLEPIESLDFLDSLIRQLPYDWDFLRLSGNLKAPAALRGKYGKFQIIECTRETNNMGLYAVSPSGAKKFIHYSSKRLRAIDEDLRRVWEHNSVCYTCSPKLVEINIFDSNIDTVSSRGSKPMRDRKASDTPNAISEGALKQKWLRSRFKLSERISFIFKMFINRFKNKNNRVWIVSNRSAVDDL